MFVAIVWSQQLKKDLTLQKIKDFQHVKKSHL